MMNNACDQIQTNGFNGFLQVGTEKFNKEQNRLLENCMLFDMMRQRYLPTNWQRTRKNIRNQIKERKFFVQRNYYG